MRGEVRDGGAHRGRRRADGDEVCARWSGPNNQEAGRIVQHAVVPPRQLDAAHGVSKAVSDEAKPSTLGLTRMTREEKPASLVDPDLKPGCSGSCDKIRITVAIHIGHQKLDRSSARLQWLGVIGRRQPDREFAGMPTGRDAIVNAVGLEVRTKTLGLRRIGNQQRRDAA